MRRRRHSNVDGVIVYRKILKFFGNRYGSVGRKVAEDLLLSLISLKCEREIKRLNLGEYIRYRRHIMLCWEVGRAKSTFLKIFKDIIPDDVFTANILSESSAEALRGGVNDRTGGFIPPEFKVSDVIIVPELSSLLKSKDDESIFNNLLTSLEDGRFRLKLLKLGGLKQDIVDRAEDYGVEISDGAMEFDSDAIMWIATHDLDVIPDKLKNAIVDRFFIKKLSINEFDICWLENVVKNKILKEDIVELKKDVYKLLNCVNVDKRIIDVVNNRVIWIIKGYLKRKQKRWDERIHLRFIGELNRIGIASMSIQKYRKNLDCIHGMSLDLVNRKFDELLCSGFSTKEFVYDLVKNSDRGMTISELEGRTGYNKMRLIRNLNDLYNLGVRKIKINKDMRSKLKIKSAMYLYRYSE